MFCNRCRQVMAIINLNILSLKWCQYVHRVGILMCTGFLINGNIWLPDFWFVRIGETNNVTKLWREYWSIIQDMICLVGYSENNSIWLHLRKWPFNKWTALHRLNTSSLFSGSPLYVSSIKWPKYRAFKFWGLNVLTFRYKMVQY